MRGVLRRRRALWCEICANPLGLELLSVEGGKGSCDMQRCLKYQFAWGDVVWWAVLLEVVGFFPLSFFAFQERQVPA